MCALVPPGDLFVASPRDMGGPCSKTENTKPVRNRIYAIGAGNMLDGNMQTLHTTPVGKQRRGIRGESLDLCKFM